MTFITVAEDKTLEDKMEDISKISWPEFMLHASGGAKYWGRLYSDFPEYQFGAFDHSGQLIAAGWSMPLKFEGRPEELPDEGWDWAMTTGFTGLEQGIAPNIQSALAIVVHPNLRGQHLSTAIVEHLKQIGRSKGLVTLIAPVRPNLKASYPLIEMDRYIRWLDSEGLPFDPWMRVHARLGATVVKPCNRAMQIYGTVDQWQSWAGMKFPESGKYVVPGALTPVDVDVDNDRGTYIEPNVWMWHDIS